VDTEHAGLVGFSAGGLATLLAANDPRVLVWVGLDPVDVAGKGAAAAKRLSAFALVLRAEPHSCNGHGNAQGIQDALTARSLCLMVTGATHADPEWPTDFLAEAVCGKSSEARRALFYSAEFSSITLLSILLKCHSNSLVAPACCMHLNIQHLKPGLKRLKLASGKVVIPRTPKNGSGPVLR
jgi:hypothetical protein